ncbi:RraA family protein [Paracoccus tegillarcae]|uniref:Acyl transferase n=1 Tax=Paracoccus tegillarcae TaxID=1529068 RepID=A0A2K9EGZ8_9RHOB|nr:RraA family protein [Paracoccus tegillarcae]AUH34248.1 acyl transferase [Paracoccus tegillarcae]
MDTDLLKLLKSVDTPTVCNAIEVAQGRRGFDQFTRGTVVCTEPEGGALVGFARTASLSAIAPPTEAPEVIRTRRMDYYRYMAEAAQPSVAVVEDLDYPNAIGAYWGEINTTVHKGFGIAGTLTNGVVRDLGDLPKGYPVIAGSVGPSHGFVHIRSIGQPVRVFGMQVADGDLIHADRHGALVVPPEVIPTLGEAIRRLLETERLVLEPASAPGFDFAAFEAAWTAFEKART